MRITGVRARVARLPVRPIVVNRSGVFDTMWYVLDDGMAGVPLRPGLGFTWDEATSQRLADTS